MTTLTVADVLAARRELAKRSLAEFARQAWHVLEPATELKWGWALDAICEHLEAVTHGEIKRLLVNVPPGPMRADSIVETGTGPRRLDEVKVGDAVLTHRGRYRRVEAVHDQGVLPILKIVTNSGRETFAAPSHPYLTPRGWVEAGRLRIGDQLAVVNRHEERTGFNPMTPEEARLLGYIVGDGAVTHSPGFVNNDRAVIEDFRACAHALGFTTSVRQRKGHSFWTVGLSGARDFLTSHNLLGKNSYTKRIPPAVMASSREAIANFVGAYWSCDGGVDVRVTRSRGSRYRAYATTVSECLAFDMVQALAFLGIDGRLRRKSRKLTTARQPGGIYRSFSIEVQNEAMTARLLALPGLCEAKRSRGEGCAADFDQMLWSDPVVSIEAQEPAHCMCLTVAEDHSFTCSGIAVKNSMKSLLTGVLWPAWEWGPRAMPAKRFIATAHKQDLAIRDNLKCRRLIQSPWFQERWPIELTSDQNAKSKFENSATGFREAMAFTSMTGSRGDRVILDDPHSVDDANSVAKLASDITTFREALPTRVNNADSAIVIIMQRLNEGDVSAAALDLGYEHLCIPMRYEPGRGRATSIGWTDPRTEAGELMFPERFSEEQVAEMERALGSYATAGQLQQRPSPRGGGIIKTGWFRFYDRIPPLEWRAIYADTAQKTGEENDWSVLQCWGRTTTGQAVLLDQVRGKWEAPDLLAHARAFWMRNLSATAAPLRAMHVEDKVSGTGLIQTMRREGLPVLAVPRNRDKVSRGHDAAPFIEAGNVLLPETAPWVSDLLAEAEAFPGGAHDDQIDPMFDAIADIQAQPAMMRDEAPRERVRARAGF